MHLEITTQGKKILHTKRVPLRCCKCMDKPGNELFLNENTKEIYCKVCVMNQARPKIIGVDEEQYYKIDEVKLIE